MEAITRTISGRRAGMTAKEIIAYGICALFWVPAVGLALHALYLLIKGR